MVHIIEFKIISNGASSSEVTLGWIPENRDDFAVGALVSHQIWGGGVITAAGETTIEISFNDGAVGSKKLAIEFLTKTRPGLLTVVTPKEEIARLRAQTLTKPDVITLPSNQDERRNAILAYLDQLSFRAKALKRGEAPSIKDIQILQALIDAVAAKALREKAGERSANLATRTSSRSPRRLERGEYLKHGNVLGEESLKSFEHWLNLAGLPPQIIQGTYHAGSWRNTIDLFTSFARDHL